MLVLSLKSCEGDTAPRDNWLERAQPTKLALGELVGICPTLGALLSEVGLLLSSFINSAPYGKGRAREKKARIEGAARGQFWVRLAHGPLQQCNMLHSYWK